MTTRNRLCDNVYGAQAAEIDRLTGVAVPAGLLLLVVRPEVYDPARAAWVVPVMVLFTSRRWAPRATCVRL